MQTLTKELIKAGLNNRIISDVQLARVFSGSDQRRYHLVNRAVKEAELVRIQRGSYLLASEYRDYPVHPFALAQVFGAGSYVSFESALSHHGWIPEAVYSIASVSPESKSKAVESAHFGQFIFYPLAVNEGRFLELVKHKQITKQSMLVAEPIRALMDLVCHRKKEWQGVEWLTEGLRIDSDQLKKVTGADIRTLMGTYKHKRVREFLTALSKELGND